MNGSGGPIAQRQSNKRSFGEMQAQYRTTSEAPSFDDHYNNDRPAQRPRFDLTLPSIRSHFPGDGYDFRRPLMSNAATTTATDSTSNNVIDLTEGDDRERSLFVPAAPPTQAAASSRTRGLPRFGRNIIDVETSEGEEQNSQHAASESHQRWQDLGRNLTFDLDSHRAHPQFSQLRRPHRQPTPAPEMDDVEIVSSRPISRPETRSSTSAHPNVRSVTPFPDQIDLTQDDDDLIEVDSRPRQGVNLQGPAATGGMGTRSVANHGIFGAPALGFGLGRVASMMRSEGRLFHRIMFAAGAETERNAHQHVPLQHRSTPRRGPPMTNMNMPTFMDYDEVGFDLGFGANRPPTPPYQPPQAPPKGFTRSPAEDEVVVCPNCGDELAMGDDDTKQQLWVVKGCGHAYCGGCAQNRRSGSSKKGKARAYDAAVAPLKKCVVDDCGKNITSKSMIQVYMS